jgi:hypothetical protein
LLAQAKILGLEFVHLAFIHGSENGQGDFSGELTLQWQSKPVLVTLE